MPAQEAQMLQNAVNQQMIPANELSGILANLGEMRAELVSSDALRSFIIIGIGCSLLWLYASGKLRRLADHCRYHHTLPGRYVGGQQALSE